MADQIVYVCGCKEPYPAIAYVQPDSGESILWDAHDAGIVCDYCHQPVRAVNITRLEAQRDRLLDLIRELGVVCMDGYVCWSLLTKERMAEVDEKCRAVLGDTESEGNDGAPF